MFSIQQRCVKSAFTTGAPGGTRGALIMYESSDMIGWKSDQSLSSAVLYLVIAGSGRGRARVKRRVRV